MSLSGTVSNKIQRLVYSDFYSILFVYAVILQTQKHTHICTQTLPLGTLM